MQMGITHAENIHLDVYRDPWIDAICQDGHTERLSLRDCLVRSKDIKSLYIKDAIYALDNTVPYTLLTMVISRVFHPDQDDKLDMLTDDGFDMEQIDLYIQSCESNGVSFDVFDETHPFLQDPEYKKWQKVKADKKSNGLATVGILEPMMVSGNNTVFYHNKNYDTNGDSVQDTLFMTPPQFIASVARNHMYHGSSGGSCGTGYVPSQPPLHCIIHGKDLFETLVISIPENLCGVPLWERRYDMSIPEIIDQYGHLDYISAALLPTTSIRFGEVENGIVKNIFYYGSLYQGKDKEKPKEFINLFRIQAETGINLMLKGRKKKAGIEYAPIGLGNCADLTSTVLQILQNFDSTGDRRFIQEALDEDSLNGPFQFVVYGGKLSASGVEPYSVTWNIPIPEALMDTTVSMYVKGIAAYVETASNLLLRELLNLERDIQSGKKLKESGAVRTIVRHFSEYACDQLIPNTMLHGTWVEQIILDPTEEKQKEIIEQIETMILKAYYSYRTRDILSSAKHAAYLQMGLAKI